MAEINVAASGTMPGVRRSKKLSTRVDLTPMVDLGFLLITFFIFTTNMSKPKQLLIFMPKEGPPIDVATSTALTVLPLGDGKIFYYHGALEEAKQNAAYGITTFSYSDGIGQVIRDKQKAMELKEPGYSKKLMLIIKPTDKSSYRNIVDIMDEVAINLVNHYALTDISESEREWMKQLNVSF